MPDGKPSFGISAAERKLLEHIPTGRSTEVRPTVLGLRPAVLLRCEAKRNGGYLPLEPWIFPFGSAADCVELQKLQISQ